MVVIAICVSALGCWPYHRIDQLEGERQREREHAQELTDLASELAVRAGEIQSLNPADSGKHSIPLWLEAASLYSASGNPSLAAVMFSSVSLAYRLRGDATTAATYRDLAATVRSGAYASDAPYVVMRGAARRTASLSGVDLATAAAVAMEIAPDWADLGLSRVAAAEKIGRLYIESGKRDSALTYFGASLLMTGRLSAQRAESLLARSPLFDSSSVATDSVAFVRNVDSLLGLIPNRPTSLGKPGSVGTATADVQALLGSVRVPAIITSNPSGLVVNYWPLIADSTQRRDVVTADTVMLRPAAYVFLVRAAKARAQESRRVSCATGCRVHFEIRQP